MKTNLSFLALAAGVLVFSSLQSQESALKTKGQVLLLQNDRVLEGEIEKIGEQFRIRRGAGELWVASKQGKKLFSSWNELVVFQKTQINLADPDERLKLAKWCQSYGKKDLALMEAKLALEIRPNHRDTIHLIESLERAIHGTQYTPSQGSNKLAVELPQADLSSESFAQFATKVQPILMNLCVSCHTGDRGGSFQLVRNFEGNRNATQRNILLTLQHINLEKPAISPLLVKSVSPHGNLTTPPMKGRMAPTFMVLESWVEQLIAGNPHLREKYGAEVKAPRELAPNVVGSAVPLTLNVPPAPAPKEAPVVSLPKTISPAKETENPVPANFNYDPQDPFNPQIFNRENAPKK